MGTRIRLQEVKRNNGKTNETWVDVNQGPYTIPGIIIYGGLLTGLVVYMIKSFSQFF